MRTLRSTALLLSLAGLVGGSLPACGQRAVTTLPILTASETDPPDVSLLQTLLTAKRPPVTFRTDDVLTVNVIGIDEYAVKQRVADDGSIIFPLIGKTQVAGLTTEQLQLSIAAALSAAGMVLDAQVSITVDLRPGEVVSVLGDVVHPGVFPANGNLTVADYLSQAVGFVESSPNAQGSSSAANYTVSLLRPSLSGPVRIPLGPRAADAAWGRIPVFPGDQIRVDKIGVIYAVGAFRLQGSYQLKNTGRTTVTQLVALAGGVGFEASGSQTHIVRKTSDGNTLLALNLPRILKGEDPDVALQPDDILFVPSNKLKAAIKGGGPSVVVSLASAALYSR